ncbi:hypothetical protein L1887_33628 [Cichorium endivia]|nr:hypothetical protein L1887_33628 [Cichorium endivia]
MEEEYGPVANEFGCSPIHYKEIPIPNIETNCTEGQEKSNAYTSQFHLDLNASPKVQQVAGEEDPQIIPDKETSILAKERSRNLNPIKSMQQRSKPISMKFKEIVRVNTQKKPKRKRKESISSHILGWK